MTRPLVFLTTIFLAITTSFAKMGPLDVAEAVSRCYAVIYAIPTAKPYIVKVVTVVLSKPGVTVNQLETIPKSPPRDPYQLEVADFPGLKQPAIIFLKRSTNKVYRWAELSGFYDWISLKNDQIDTELTDFYKWPSEKPIQKLAIGYLRFPLSLCPRYRGYATRKDLIKEIGRIYQVQKSKPSKSKLR